MTAVQRLEMLLMGFLLGSREQVKINAFGTDLHVVPVDRDPTGHNLVIFPTLVVALVL
ncbi:MAG: hypothetical protein VXW18_10955 [Pseudomonadota bacterium]|nr:hypothetical protein [Pseudomonadota bacterium]